MIVVYWTDLDSICVIKQLNNIDDSVITGKSQTLAYRIDLAIDLAIARSIRRGFFRNDLTLGY